MRIINCMQGIILIDKPAGWTSFDAVAKVRGVIRKVTGEKIKVGHSGTLDPMATGLLVLAIGKATKSIPTLVKVDKTYIAEVTLGAVSTTDDAEGQITPRVAGPPLTEEQVREALIRHIGFQSQLPPDFSAIKIGGKRAYALARKGENPTLEPRTVTIYDISDIDYSWPLLSFKATVSSGTYIRALARDIGQELEVGAYLSRLRRVQVGKYQLKEAISPDGISIERITKHLLPVENSA